MMLFIPPLGTKLKLLETWHFELHHEYRNSNAISLFSPGTQFSYSADPLNVFLPMGTILNVERIYIRSGASDYDSVTFRVIDCPDKTLAPKKVGGSANGSCRFWAKLHDVNHRLIADIV